MGLMIIKMGCRIIRFFKIGSANFLIEFTNDSSEELSKTLFFLIKMRNYMETLKWVGNDNTCFAVMFVLDIGKVKKKREALPGVVQWIGCRTLWTKRL